MARHCICGDFRVDNPQPAATMPQHGIGLVQLVHAARDFVHRYADLAAQLLLLLGLMRQEFVEGRIERANGHRPALHGLEDAFKIAALIRQEFVEGFLARFGTGRRGSSRAWRRCDPLQKTCVRCGKGRCLRRRRQPPP